MWSTCKEHHSAFKWSTLRQWGTTIKGIFPLESQKRLGNFLGKLPPVLGVSCPLKGAPAELLCSLALMKDNWYVKTFHSSHFFCPFLIQAKIHNYNKSTYFPNCFHLEKKSCEFISVGAKNLEGNSGTGRTILWLVPFTLKRERQKGNGLF